MVRYNTHQRQNNAINLFLFWVNVRRANVSDFQLIDFFLLGFLYSFVHTFWDGKNWNENVQKPTESEEKNHSFFLFLFLSIFLRANWLCAGAMWMFNVFSPPPFLCVCVALELRFVYHVIWHLARHNTNETFFLKNKRISYLQHYLTLCVGLCELHLQFFGCKIVIIVGVKMEIK